MGEAEDHGMGERRQLSQSSVELLDFRIKQLEDARLLIRMQSAETAIDQVRAEVRTIADLSRGISTKLDTAVQELGDRQDEEYQNLHGAQIKFMAFVRAGLWICGAIGAAFGFFVSFADPINRIFQALASTPGAGN